MIKPKRLPRVGDVVEWSSALWNSPPQRALILSIYNDEAFRNMIPGEKAYIGLKLYEPGGTVNLFFHIDQNYIIVAETD